MQLAGIGRQSGEAGTGGHAARSASPQRLVNAAHEFEGQMMKELLSPMSAGDGLGGDEEEAGSVLGEFATEALARGISQRGGLGIADRIVGELSRSGT